MNIGEKDADGWTYVRFGDAAKAAQEGAHEVEEESYVPGQWSAIKCVFTYSGKYRIKEKARTITVTDLPKPKQCEWHELPEPHVRLYYGSEPDASGACNIIRAAMEQS